MGCGCGKEVTARAGERNGGFQGSGANLSFHLSPFWCFNLPLGLIHTQAPPTSLRREVGLPQTDTRSFVGWRLMFAAPLKGIHLTPKGLYWRGRDIQRHPQVTPAVM